MTRVGLRALAIAVVVATGTQAALVSLAAEGATPPPTPVPPAGSPSPFVSALRTPADHLRRPSIQAPEALLADLDTGQAMFAKAPDVRRPIASLTKVMTALIVLERRDLDDVIEVSPDAVFAKHRYGATSTLGLEAGERLPVGDLLYALLLQSSNDVAEALAIDVSGSVQAFVRLMNRRAAGLGMGDTKFFSPHGLDDRGYSTAHDLLRLIRAAYRTEGFPSIVATKFRTIPAPSGPPRVVQNRNVLLWLYPGAIGAKTGLTFGAGFCVLAVAQRDGRRLVSIVLGGEREPFSEAAALLDHGFDGFTSRTFFDQGDPVGNVQVRGGVVPGVTAARITALVPTAELGAIGTRVVVDPDAAYPPTVGTRIATISISASGVTYGRAPVLATRVALPEPPSGGPWWLRTAGAVGRALIDVVSGVAA